MEKAIANTSSLVFIAKLNLFKLVKNLFSLIFVPEQVIEELFIKDNPENLLIKKEIQNNFIKEVKIKNIKDLPLDVGEKAAISLCLEKNIKTFLSDDKKARNYARSLKLKTIGILGILLWNFQHNKIRKDDFIDYLNKLIDFGYYISPGLYFKIMQLVG